MSPESRFTRSSRKRLRALSKAVNNVVTPNNHYIIAGREAAAVGVSDAVYVEVRYYDEPGWYRSRRFYFDSKPTKRTVRQVVNLMIEVLEKGA